MIQQDEASMASKTAIHSPNLELASNYLAFDLVQPFTNDLMPIEQGTHALGDQSCRMVEGNRRVVEGNFALVALADKIVDRKDTSRRWEKFEENTQA